MSEDTRFVVREEPFPHIVCDNFTDPELLREVVRQWPGPEAWLSKACRTSIKASCAEMELMPHAARTVIDALYAPAFLDKLGDAFGLRLSPDPQYHRGHLEGGGLHMIPRGGHLGMHVDFNRHPKAEWVRVANLLLYLNEDWRDEWAGHLRIEWPDGRLADRIAPAFNRMVAFATSESSWHGHPEPLECPEGQSRKSIAVYYYSRNAKAGAGHGTIYR